MCSGLFVITFRKSLYQILKNISHIKDNLDILDFRLTEGEMSEIAKLDKGERYYHRTDEQLAGFAAWRPEFEKE